MKITTCSWTSLIIASLIGSVISAEIGVGGLKKGKSAHKKLRTEKVETGSDASSFDKKHADLPDLPIYFQGWVKYLHYKQKDAHKPKAFYKNIEFNNQLKRGIYGPALTATDEGGFINIPNELNFYSILYKDTFNVFTTRQDGLLNAIDSLDIDHIRPVPEDDHFRGGITDFGHFDEGYCFKINIKVPSEPFTPSVDTPEPDKGVDHTWVICLDKEENKTQMMNVFINLKLKSQHKKGIYLEIVKDQNRTTDSANNFSDNFNTGNSPSDGYWILLQNWTQCTLKCGGGLQYQQLMCAQPKTGGKPCEGPAIRTRPCNTQACPQVKVIQNGLNPADPLVHRRNNTLPAVVKMMAVSQRPQRYDKCFIKEGDALMEKDDATTQNMSNKPRIPVRLVLNDKTISAYLDDMLNDNVGTFNLKETVFVRITNEKRCFKLKTNSKQAMFCQLDSVGGDFIEEWDYDFNLFKHQCKKDRVKSNTLLHEEEKLEQDFKKKVAEAKSEMVLEIVEENKHKVEQNEEVKLTKKVQQVQSTSMMALQKETKLEELLEREEEAKEDSETKTLEAEIESEKNKAECLNKVIKEKEMENQMNIAKYHAEDEIKNIQEVTKLEVAKKRLDIKKKIMEMRKKQERKKAALKGEIMTIRTTLANKLSKLSKVGNAECCINSKTQIQRQTYCSSSFADNYIKYQDCFTESSFCYVCCENEFGDFHVLERDKCYARCDATKTFQ